MLKFTLKRIPQYFEVQTKHDSRQIVTLALVLKELSGVTCWMATQTWSIMYIFTITCERECKKG